MSGQGFETRSVHAGWTHDPATGACAPPLYQTTSYVFPDAETAAARYALSADGDIYSRISNPTVRALEQRLASLENGAGAVATATGMAALDAATFLLAPPGTNVVTSSAIYGGTTAYFNTVANRRGVEPRFVDPSDISAFESAIDDETAFVHIETIGNPALIVADIEAIADVAHAAGVPLLVDNTFATPYLCRPIDHGADLVWESTTKWLHGAGTTLGGVLVDGGTFEWEDSKYDELFGLNEMYHDTDFSRDFPQAPFAAAARFRSLRLLGAGQSPFGAWQTLQGLLSFPFRMCQHCENAAIVAEYLDEHPAVEWVLYPGLEHHESHDTAATYLMGGFGGMIAFGLQGGYDAGRRVCEHTELATFLANIGDARTLIIHPGSTTHGQLTPEQQRSSGVTPDLIRLSVGLETPADIIADLDQAIGRAVTGANS